MKSNNRSGLSRSLIAVTVAVLLGHANVMVAASPPKHFDIGTQMLSTALSEFAKQSDRQILFSTEVVHAKRTDGIKQKLEPEAALRLLLQGTGLTFRVTADNTFLVESLRQGDAASASIPQNYLRLAQAATTQNSSENQSTTENSGNPRKPPLASSETEAAKLEEIVVTAERREESVQSLPIAISAYSGETLVERGIVNVEDLRQIAPSLNTGNKQFGYMQVSMRGVSSLLGGAGTDPTIALSQDGVPYSYLSLFGFDLLDVERVEVLRGPQGTISGRNATAGAINVITNRPTQTFEGGLKGTFGNYGRIATEGFLSGPIAGDRLLGRFAVRMDRSDGWLDNTARNQDLGAVDRISARGSLRAHISDDLQIDLIAERVRDRSNYTFTFDSGRARPDQPSIIERFGLVGLDRDNHTIQLDQETDLSLEQDQLTAIASWDITSSAKLTSTTGYIDFSKKFIADDDGTSLPIVEFDGLDPVHQTIKQFSQELTFAADLTNRLDVIVGGLYSDSRLRFHIPVALPLLGLPFNPSAPIIVHNVGNLETLAAYTQSRYKLTENLRLTAGIRYTHDEKPSRDQTTILGSPSIAAYETTSSAWTPRVSLAYEPNEDLTIYATFSRGYKAGGFAVPNNPYDPETVSNYEIGIKSRLFEERVATALTAFYMDYKDLQLQQYGLNELSFLPTITNAASSKIKGIELEVEARLAGRFRINGSGTWLDAKYRDFRSADPLYPELGVPGPAGLNVRDASGKRLLRAPEWQAQASGEYAVPLSDAWEGIFRAAYSWQSEVYFDYFNNPLINTDAYGLVNLSAGVESNDDRWQITAFVNNLTDKYYETMVYVRTESGAPGRQSTIGSPRMYGLSVAHRF